MSPAPVTSAAPAVVVGGGPAGLAVAAEMKRIGVIPVILEKGDRPGARWTERYNRLHLHTARRFSSLPGFPIPRGDGQWVSRDSFIRYLNAYGEHHRLEVRTGVEAVAVRREGDGWLVDWTDGVTGGTIATRVVVVATGLNAVPHIPDWPGRDVYEGQFLHSSDYRSPEQLSGRRVLVIGAGNSGAEISAELAETGRTVQLAIRTPPNIVLRQTGGVPSQALAIAVARLPVSWGDSIARITQRWTVGDLSAYGIPPSPRGIATQLVRDDVAPTIDVGLIDALRRGTVHVVAAVTGFDRERIHLADGAVAYADAVVAATGFRPDVLRLLGDLPVVSPEGRPVINGADQLPGFAGLYFIGFVSPFGGHLRQDGIDARAIARSARRRYTGSSAIGDSGIGIAGVSIDEDPAEEIRPAS
jgi:putative flavoprotein involved in K+ transport